METALARRVGARRGALQPRRLGGRRIREALAAGTDWAAVWRRLGLLAALALVMAWLGTRAFRTYQQSL